MTIPLAAPPPPVPAPKPTSVDPNIAKILKEVKLPERFHQKAVPAPAGQAPALGVLPTLETPAGAASAAREVPRVVVPPAQLAQSVGDEALVAPLTPPVPASVPDQPEEGAASSIASLHTMKADLKDVVRSRKISLVSAAAMEQDRGARRALMPTMPAPLGGDGRRIGLMLTAALLLLGLGGAALYFAYTLVAGPTTHQQLPASASVLFAENQVAVSLGEQSSSGLKQSLGGLLSQPGPVGSITQIIPTLPAPDSATGQRAATLQEFFQTLGAHPPADLMRALSGDFFLGIHMADVPAPVFIIPVVSYDRAFAGMLAWESSIDTDLAPLFRQVPRITASPTGGVPVERTFKDLVVRNYDVRGLADDSGAIVLYYSFPTPEILIIAASPYTFPEVLSRLQAERKL